MASNNDLPKWLKELGAMVRVSLEEAREDRKQAAEDRKEFARRAEEDRKQVMVVVETAIEASAKQFAEIYKRSTDEAARDRKETLKVGVEIARKLGNISSQLHDINDTNHEILITLKGNGHGGNGNRRNGNSRRK